MSLSIAFKITMERKALEVAAAKANRQALGKAGAYIRGMAMRSIKISDKSAAPGNPPTSRKGVLKKAIAFNREGSDTVSIGPTFSRVGLVGRAHEFGGREVKTAKGKAIGDVIPIAFKNGRLRYARMKSRNQLRAANEAVAAFYGVPPGHKNPYGATRREAEYPPRPFMAPALERSRDRIPEFWRASING